MASSSGSKSENREPKAESPPPLYTFRGHKAGVSALTSLGETLISGDEAGAIHFWSLANFRQRNKWTNIASSRIQSLKLIRLPIKTVSIDLLVCQTRDNGVKLIRCDNIDSKDPSSLILLDFPTYEALFSRGDAVTANETNAVLAYPSNVASHMVAVRYLGPDARTLLSGNASRAELSKNPSMRPTVFDIKLVPLFDEEDSHLIACGYEDGLIVIYRVNSRLTKTVPELNVTGLQIETIQELGFQFKDFVGAFDVKLVPNGLAIVCGSVPLFIAFCTLKSDFSQESVTRVRVSRSGASAITIRDDLKLVAIADWGSCVQLFSMKSRIHLASLGNHQKKIQSIIFVNHTEETRTRMCCASLDKTISIHEIY